MPATRNVEDCPLGMRCGWAGALRLPGAVLALAALSGCQGTADLRSTETFAGAYGSGAYAEAAAVLGGPGGLDYDAENLLTSLHVGSALRAGGRFGASTEAFDRAEAQLLWKSDEIASAADLVEAGFTLVGNELMRSYEGTIYDGVLVNTFKAMNAVSAGDPGRARVELNRADQRQVNAVDQLAAKVQALGAPDPETEAHAAAHGDAVEQSMGSVMDPGGDVAKRLAAVREMGEYRDLRNPFTDWLHGIFRMATGEPNRASDLFRNAAVLDGQRNPHVLADLVLAEAAAEGTGGAAPRVWVVHEDGTGPRFEEFKLVIPVYTENGVLTAAMAIPEFVRGGGAVGRLRLAAGGREHVTETLLDVDRYAATEFRAGYDAVVAKAVASGVIRLILQGAIQNEMKDEGAVGQLVGLLAPIVSAATTQADTRSWTALPHTVGVAGMERPADGVLRIATLGGTPVAEVALPPGRFVLVTVKTVAPGAPPAVHAAAFGEG